MGGFARGRDAVQLRVRGRVRSEVGAVCRSHGQHRAILFIISSLVSGMHWQLLGNDMETDAIG